MKKLTNVLIELGFDDETSWSIRAYRQCWASSASAAPRRSRAARHGCGRLWIGTEEADRPVRQHGHRILKKVRVLLERVIPSKGLSRYGSLGIGFDLTDKTCKREAKLVVFVSHKAYTHRCGGCCRLWIVTAICCS